MTSPQTRVTDYDERGAHVSKWDGGEMINVQIGSGEIDTYTLKTGGAVDDIKNNTPAYW